MKDWKNGAKDGQSSIRQMDRNPEKQSQSIDKQEVWTGRLLSYAVHDTTWQYFKRIKKADDDSYER